MTYIVRDGCLMHAEERKKHKYYAKVKISEDKTRYFYSKEEYQAYLNGKRKGKDGKTIGERGRGVVEGFLTRASKAASDAQKGLSKFASDVQEEASKAVGKAAQAIQNGKRIASNAMKQTTKAISEFASSGKAAATKALNNVKKTAIQTLDKAKKIAGDVKKGVGKAAKSVQKKVKKVATEAKRATSKTVSKAGNALNKAKRAVSSNLKKSVKALSKFVAKGKKIVSSNLKKATASVSKSIAKGKRTVSKLLPKPIKDRLTAKKKRQARIQQLKDDYAREAKAKVQQATTPARKAALERGAKHQNGRSGKDEPDYEVQSTAMRKSLSAISKNDPFPQFDKKDYYANRSEDLLMVNPNFSNNPFSDYAVNCSYCGLTYEMRRRGYDVEAKPLADNDCTEILRQWTMYKQFDISEADIADILSSGEREPYESKINELAEKYGVFTNRRFAEAVNAECGYSKINPDEIQTNSGVIRDNLSSSDMSRMSTEYMVSQGEGARGIINVYWNGGGGHCMSWEVTNGQATIYDSQTNETHTVSEICECSVPYSIYRTDNLELSDEVTDWVMPSSGRKNKNNR